MSIHYKYGGSTADRTIACPAWHNLSKNMPSGPPSPSALEGTLMHLLFEMGVEDAEFEPNAMVGEERIIDGVRLAVTEEHVEKVYTAYDELDNVVRRYELDEVLAEVVMNTDDETGGTADIIGWTVQITPNDYCDIFAVLDLKTGDGYMVNAKNNSQLLFYAWQAVEKYKREGVRFNDETVILLGIIQPSDRRDEYTDLWEVELKTVLDFGKKYRRAQKEAKAGIMTPCAGSHCRFCPAQPTCPAKTGMIHQTQRIPAGSKELADLNKALQLVDEAEEWCRAVRKVAHEQAEAGVKLDGFKLVNKRATRQWVDPAEAMETFKRARSLSADDYLDQKMKSPAQLEKTCKAKGVDFKKYESMIHLHSSGTTLVKESDKRPEALPLPALQNMAKRLKA